MLFRVEFRALPPYPQELLIIPLLPMALVAPDEVEKNSSPLYRYNTELAWGEGEDTCLGRACLASLLLPTQLSGRRLGQPEGFQDEHVYS